MSPVSLRSHDQHHMATSHQLDTVWDEVAGLNELS